MRLTAFGFAPLAVVLSVLLTISNTNGALAQAPYVDPSRDSELLGEPEDNLFWSAEEKVVGFRNSDKLFPTRMIRAGDKPRKLTSSPVDLANVPIVTKDRTLDLNTYLTQQSVAGLLVLKNGAIVYEYYGLGNNKNSLWDSFSVAKSVTALLVGAAIADGYIHSADDRVSDYLPRLRGTAYAQLSIRHLLQMSSGVEWNEDYADPEADINSVPWETLAMYEFLNGKKRVSQAGERFNYNTAETNVAGDLVRAAVGNNLSTYLSHKIWQPFGMTTDANWQLVEEGGGEFGGSSINATLRDYALLGLFALENGQLADGSRILPANWMQESTTPSQAALYYGYLWWLRSNNSYHAMGIFGQGIYVAPDKGIVIALQSARDDAYTPVDGALELALFEALTKAVSLLH